MENLGDKQYKPQPISARKPDSQPIPPPPTAADRAILETEAGFVQIDLVPDERISETPIPQAQTVRSAADPRRMKFYAMRKIGMNHNPAGMFYQQAIFMQDYEDDYTEKHTYSAYYPSYQQMSYEQLRTYFAWRTQVRQGKITHISLSYAFLYIYELLHNIGVSDPTDGLYKFYAFWQTYRTFDNTLDRYCLQWLKDYHVYYPLPRSFKDFAAEKGLLADYPTVFGYETDRENSLELFAGISKYTIKKSVFYTAQPDLLRDCFYHVLTHIRTLLAEKNKRFEDFIFYTSERETIWNPFIGAVFHPAIKQPNRRVAISERETYQCRDNRWSGKTIFLTEQGRQLVGIVLKETEVQLRKILKYRFKLASNLHTLSNTLKNEFTALGLLLPQLIAESVAEFNQKRNWKKVEVDITSLSRIRTEALEVQEKLIVPEDIPEIIEPIPKIMSTSDPEVTGWEALKTSLTPAERGALRLVLQNGNLVDYARERGIMLEVLIDGINQKALDHVNDAILELTDTVDIYEDYVDLIETII